ncbi:MAG TPA: cysteine--tRNA ligase [Mycobacteriales bacterium]|nr:cysteine--tRNA ligase [Mycobacteriales bacterium]
MTLRLHDTRTGRVEEIVPATHRLLRIYACGPTVYRDAHVGNMRSFLLPDLIGRVARRQGWRVDLVMNITDVGHLVEQDAGGVSGEDKIVGQARAEGRSIAEVAAFYEERFHADLAALNITPARRYPKASECIGIMLELTERLIAQGHAYVDDERNVWFDARSFDGYGAISHNRLDALQPSESEAGAGKRFHADWALWKATTPEAPVVFESPWGPGFPGWHLECSAMSLADLGEHIDIHTGGIDLRFPHHEDERAQTEAAVGHEVVRHWVHGEHILFEGRKMAKSTGNVVLVRDVIERGLDPLAIRLAFLRTRYRQQTDLSWDAIEAADKALRRWRTEVARWAESPSRPMNASYAGRIEQAFADDLDTPRAVVALQDLVADSSVDEGSRFETAASLDDLFGLDLVRDVGRAPDALPTGARELLDERAQARQRKDFETSDRLRDDLAALGVQVTDSQEGQRWSVR